MGNCFSADDTNPENSIHPQEENAIVNGGKHSNISTANSSPLNSSAMDPKLISLLDFFKQLHGRNEELFSEVIPVHKDAIVNVFRKINHEKEDERVKNGWPRFQLMLKRSHSTGSVVTRGVELSDGDFKLQRFKVKTLDIGNEPPASGQGGGPGGGGSKPPGAAAGGK